MSLWKGFSCELFIRLVRRFLVSKSTLFVFKIINGELNTNALHAASSKQIIAVRIMGQVLADICLSIIKIIQVRLVVQTNNKNAKKYKGTIDCIKKMHKEEGILHKYILGSSFIASTLYYTVMAISQVSTSYFIFRKFKLNGPNRRPFALLFTRLLFKTIELVVSLPLETIANRIHIQQTYKSHTLNFNKKYTPVVMISPIKYLGIYDGLQRIIFEEGLPNTKEFNKKLRNKNQIYPSSFMGISGIYRDFSLRWMWSLLSISYSSFFGRILN